MRFANYLTYRPSGFAFRLIVPADLQPVVGRRVIKKALRTHDRVMAQAIGLGLAAQYALTFRQLRGQRGGGMAGKAPPSVAELVQGFLSGENEVYHLDIAQGIMSATDEADHQRAMEALSRIEAVMKAGATPPIPPAPPTKGSPEKPTPRPSGLALGAAIGMYTAIEASGLKADTWDGRHRALKTFVAFFGKRRPPRWTWWTLGMAQTYASEAERAIRRLDIVQMEEWCQVCGTTLLALIEEYEARKADPAFAEPREADGRKKANRSARLSPKS